MGRKRKEIPVKIEPIQNEVPMSISTENETVVESVKIAMEETQMQALKKELAEAKARLAALRAPARELDEHELALVDRQISRTNNSAALREKIEKQKKIDSEMVTGKFINRRAPGQMAKLTYSRYDTDPVKWYEFQDGKVYTIPRGFADEIREYYHSPVFNQKIGPMDPNLPDSQIHSVDTSNKKYDFVATSY